MTTMLIVDDHDAFRAQARRLLEDDGFTVLGEAADGAEALAAVRRHRPQFVLLDIGLPDVDGIEVAKRIADERSRDASDPIVILTSSRDASAYGTRLRSAQAAAFIRKEDLSGDAIRAAVDAS